MKDSINTIGYQDKKDKPFFRLSEWSRIPFRMELHTSFVSSRRKPLRVNFTMGGGEAVGRHPRKTEGNEPTPEGVEAPSIKIPRVVFNTCCYPCRHPSGVQSLSRSYPGGIARCRELNHRLMALNPPGSLLTVVPKDLHPKPLPRCVVPKGQTAGFPRLPVEVRIQ